MEEIGNKFQLECQAACCSEVIVEKFCLAIVMGLMAGSALASDFDTCVLEHMQGVTSDFAAKSIKKSCVRMAERELSPNPAQWRASYGNVSDGLESSPRLIISLNNDTGYSITEIAITLQRKGGIQSYVIRLFPDVPHLPPGAFISGPPLELDPTAAMIIGPGIHEFWIAVSPPPDAMELQRPNAWNVVSVKGWKD